MPNGRCHKHGGSTPSGIAAGAWKHGRYSKVQPTEILDRYLRAQSDPDLLGVRDDIALLDARIGHLLDADTATAEWSQARALLSGMINVRGSQADRMEQRERYLRELQTLIERGVSEHQRWYEIRNALQDRRKLVESERKRLVEMQQMVTVEQLLGVVSSLMDSFRRHVSDPEILREVGREYRAIVERTG